MKEKILIIGQIPPPYHGSNVMANVMLSALDKNGYDTIFIDKSFSKSIHTIGKLSLRKILRVPVLAIEIIIAGFIKRPSVCIYFLSVGKSAFIVDAFQIFLLRLSRLPYILRFGGKGYRKLQNEGCIWHFLVSMTLSSALGGIVLGQSIKWDVNLFIPDDRLFCVPNGLSNHPLVSIRSCNRVVQILFLSNLVPSKGPLEVLRAAKIVIQKQENIRFILAGANVSKSFTKKLMSYILKNELGEYVKLPGKVIGEEKEKLFAESDIFVFPTYFNREIFGMVNVEAMSWGLPVISSNEGVISEIVQDGINGFIVNPKSKNEIADKILILANNFELRNRMGLAGREAFEAKYTLDAHAKCLDKAIRYFLYLK